MSRQPVITAGTIAGIFLAGWQVLVAQGMTEFLRPEARDALNAFINLLVPIIAAAIAARVVTPTASPHLPEGTSVTLADGTSGKVVAE